MYWAIGAAILLVAALLADQIALWAERKRWIYWRKHRRDHPKEAATGALGELQALLSPSYRHTIAESEAKKSLRVDQETGDGNGVTVDLGNNVVRIPRTAGARSSEVPPLRAWLTTVETR